MANVGNFPAIAALFIFCSCIVVTILLVFKPVSFRVPLPGRLGRPKLTIRYYVAPVAAVLAMLACTSMSIKDVGTGLLGNDQIKPYGILVLFMSMAYIAAALDASGVFAWLALKITVASGGRGMALFLFYFGLSAFMTTFTSNDVCILTLTPIVIYFSKATGVDPLPYLFAEYAAANTFGALLYTGNPTNIIVAQAYDMTFLGYSKYMSLPTLAGGAACCLVLWLQFRSSIPSRIPLPTVDASQLLRSVLAAVVGSVVMLTCLALLAAAPSLGWELWAITLVCAGVHLVFNVWAFRDSLAVAPFEGGWLCGLRAGEVEGAKAGDVDGAAVEGVGERDGSRYSGCSSDEESGRGKEIAAVEGREARRAGANGGAAAAAANEAHVQRIAALSLSGATATAAAAADAAAVALPAGEVFATAGPYNSAHGTNSTSNSTTISSTARAYGSSIRLASPTNAVQPPGPVAESRESGDPPAASLAVACGGLPGAAATPTAMHGGAADANRTAAGTNELEGVDSYIAIATAAGEGPAAAVAAAAPVAMGVDMLRGAAPTFWSLLWDLPWEVVPFALGMFVLVEALYVQGWLDVFGSGLGHASSSLPAAVFLMGALSVVLANAVNNQPMTILLTRVALAPRYIELLGSVANHQAALFSLVMGSNVGAVFTIIGALAGILWSNIMRQHGLHMSYGHFARVCVPVGLATISVSLLVLWFEFAVFPPGS